MRVGNLCDAGVNDSGRPNCARVVCDPGAMINMCSSLNGGILKFGKPYLQIIVMVVLKISEPYFTG